MLGISSARDMGQGALNRTMKRILKRVADGQLSVDAALEHIRDLSFQPLKDFAKLDAHRELRAGFPEVVFGESKTLDQLHAITQQLYQQNSRCMATRVRPDIAQAFIRRTSLPDVVYHEPASLLTVGAAAAPRKDLAYRSITVACAGTADYAVAEEAALTAEFHGFEAERIYDIGVAGLPRLLSNIDRLRQAHAVVCVAGMEGALPSVLGGLVSCPIIAVPTSVGYGASFQGVTPLLAMLNACAPGIAVVNIDNGFGAMAMCIKMLQMQNKRTATSEAERRPMQGEE